MRKLLPVFASVLIVGIAAYVVVSKKNETKTPMVSHTAQKDIGNFVQKQSCAIPPQFLKKLHIPQPVMIDLTQKRFKGIALLYGKNFEQAVHPKIWERYEHFGTYTVDKQGNIYLAPMPFVSIKPTTFNLQKNIYKLDSKTGALSIFISFEDIHPSPHNPYGLNAVVFDCEDNTLWASAIDESDYGEQKGVIYHINIKTKEILQRIEGWDALGLALTTTDKGKFLLFGSARDSGLYTLKIKHQHAIEKPQKLFEIANSQEHIRKIKIKNTNRLEVQTIPFSYTLIAQSSTKDRLYYRASWNEKADKWMIQKTE